MTATATCRHGVDHYVSSCGQCDRERKQYSDADKAYQSISHVINGGSTSIVAAVFAHEHPYLLQQLAESMALAVLRRTYERICRESSSGRIHDFGIHPEHDGRLSCGTVTGALRTLAVAPDETEANVLKSREFWLSRIYEPEGY